MPDEKEARADNESARGGSAVAGLGVQVAPAAQVQGAGADGLVVTEIDPDSAAAQKGVRRGDVIVEAAGRPINSQVDLSSAIDQARQEGRKSVLLRLKSADGMKFVAVPTKAG